MGKVAISSSKIEASGKIGGRNTKGSINDKGAVEIGVDFKVGGLGVTTDYGGGIKVSIAGQSITWGREGGNIKLNVGSFEVIVEARNCVVTETKKIAGIKVAEHTYPDPGCKLEEPKDPPDPPKPPDPPPFDPEKGIEIPDTTDFGWLICNEYVEQYQYGKVIQRTTVTRSSSEFYENFISSLPFSQNYSSQKNPFFYAYENLNVTVPAGASVKATTQVIVVPATPLWESMWGPDPYKKYTGYSAITLNYYYNGFNYIEVAFYGTGKKLKEYVAKKNEYYESLDFTPRWIEGPGAGAYNFGNGIKVKTIPVKWFSRNQKPPRPFLPTGNKPPMNKDCCEEILDKLDDFEEIFHVDFFKENKFPVPAYLLAPGCDAQATTEIKNYYGLFRALFQALAHGTIISPKNAIQDTDSVKEGDQSLNSEYLSATGWAEAITKMMYEVVDDGNVATNMDIRTGVTVTQLLVAVADLSHKIDTIIDVIGVTTIRKKDTIETSFSLVNQDNKKGFDPKKDNQKIDLNDDRSTEEVLAGLLQTRKNPIVKEEIHPKSKTLVELLEALKNK